MWTMREIEDAFYIFKRMASDPAKIEVWWRDDGLCVFNAPSPAEMRGDDHPTMTDEVRAKHVEIVRALERLKWRWEDNPHEYGDVCWTLFRSD